MKSYTRLFAGLFLAALVCVWCTQPSFGQAAATIRGTVLDPQGKAVPKAKVTARSVDTGQDRKTETTDDGIFVIPSLPSGMYDLTVVASGFAKGIATGIKVAVGDVRDVNFNLALAAVATEVKVTGETPLIETTKTDISSTVSDKQMEGLPIFNSPASPLNDYENLATTAPGVRFDQSGNSNDIIGPGAFNFRDNLVNIDGGDITDQVVSGRDVLGASLDEVKEFQVITNNYTAEYGQAGSVILNVITKSGTNAFHGSAHAFFRGRNLGASNFWYNETDPNAAFRRAPFQRQTWGVTAGGPFVKDKTFWFVNFEKTHNAVPLTLTNQPPSGAAVTVDSPTNEILWTAKVDHQLLPNHQLTMRFNVDRQFNDNVPVQLPSAAASPLSLTTFPIHDLTFNVGLVSSVSSHVVNEGRFFWHRYLNLLPPKTTLPGVETASFYSGAAFCCPQGGLQHRYQYIDNLTWTTGAHTIKGGVNISHFPYSSLFQQYHFGLYDLRVNTLTMALGPGFVQTSDTIYGLYLQDSWKLRPNLTFNYGLRYDYEDGGLKGGTQARAGGGCFQGNGIIPACSKDTNNWQPRFGLAWTPRYDSGFLHTLFGGPDKTVIRASFAEVTELAFLNVSLDSFNFDGVTLLTASAPFNPNNPNDPITQAFKNNKLPSPAVLAPFVPANFFGRVRPISPKLKNPEVRHFGLDIARQMGNNFVVDVGYIGVLGFGQFGENDINYPAILPDPAHAGFFFLGTRPDSRFLAIRQNQNTRTSAYHGGYVSVQKKYANHFLAQGYYSYSKTLTSTEDFYGTSEPGDPRCIRCERGPAQNDLRHMATFTFVTDTNNLVKEGFVGHIINNWSMGWVGTLHSGPHYPISTGEGAFSGSVFAGIGAGTTQRPNVMSDGTLIATNVASRAGGNLQISQANSSACPTCTQTTFLAPSGAGSGPLDSITGDKVDFQFLNGNLGNNIAVGDPYYRFDVSLGKTFHIRERIGLEFRVDVVNVFNHVNFTLFNGSDILDLFPIGVTGSAARGTGVGIHGTCDPTVGPCVADPNCVNCIRAAGPLLGRYINAKGNALKFQDFLHGRVSKDIAKPLALGLGDPTANFNELPRQMQLSFRIKW